MLELVHKKYGKRPLAELFEPALLHADQRFRVSHRLHMLLKKARHLRANLAAASYFYKPDGTPVAIARRGGDAGPTSFRASSWSTVEAKVSCGGVEWSRLRGTSNPGSPNKGYFFWGAGGIGACVAGGVSAFAAGEGAVFDAAVGDVLGLVVVAVQPFAFGRMSHGLPQVFTPLLVKQALV